MHSKHLDDCCTTASRNVPQWPPVVPRGNDANADRAALMEMFETKGGSSWDISTGWATSRPLDEWHGVTVGGQGRVIYLDLSGNNLAGW